MKFDAHVLPNQAQRAWDSLRPSRWAGLRRRSSGLWARKNVLAMFDGGVWGLVKLTGTVAPDVNTNRAIRGQTWP